MEANKFAITALAVAAAVSVRAVTLVEDGAAKCSIVLGDVGAPGAYGAAELADYLAKITGAEIVVGNNTRDGYLPVFFARKGPDTANWPTEAKSAANQVKDDGFAVVATPAAVYVYARESRGLIYSAYDILKRCGDCRWFFPGPEGEYLPKRPSFEIPNGVVVSNPTFRKRFLNFVCYNRGKALEAFKWQLRNNMIVIGNPGYPDFERFGMFYEVGGHVFSTLLPDTLFNDHPEYFCMVRGRRLPQSGKVDANGKYVRGSAQANQPCLSNPETRRIMKENLLKLLLKKPIPDQLQIINNDSRQWCECANCVAMDPPVEKFRGGRATRYWTFVNDLLSHARQYLPGLDVQVLGYQDFQMPPGADSPVAPDRNATVPLAVHQRCYAHSMGEESCRINARFRKTFAAWKESGVKLATYEYSNMMPGDVHRYNPLERIIAEDLKYYASLGLESYIDEVPPYLAEYNMKRWGVGTTVAMRANWLAHYAQAQFLWDAKSDYAAVVEDAGSKFYGKAWPAMKTYKAKLEELFFGAGIHFMYGTSGRALGKVFADAAAEKRVYALLDQAAAAAKGDVALEAKIALEREWLKGSWSNCAEDYRQRACKTFAIPKSSPLIDGDPSGASWASIPVAAKDFKKRSDIVPAKHQTEVKLAWDAHNLYFGVTCFDERAPEVSSQHIERDSLVWEDNDIEFFIAPENLGGAEVHLAINAKGAVYDTLALGQGGNADLAFDAKAVVRTRVLADRWTATVAVPFASFGVEPKPDVRIPVNVGRLRQLLDPNEKIEVSCWNSFFHGPEVFNSIELSVSPDVARGAK